jgi:hypothetical protein
MPSTAEEKEPVIDGISNEDFETLSHIAHFSTWKTCPKMYCPFSRPYVKSMPCLFSYRAEHSVPTLALSSGHQNLVDVWAEYSSYYHQWPIVIRNRHRCSIVEARFPKFLGNLPEWTTLCLGARMTATLFLEFARLYNSENRCGSAH